MSDTGNESKYSLVGWLVEFENHVFSRHQVNERFPLQPSHGSIQIHYNNIILVYRNV